MFPKAPKASLPAILQILLCIPLLCPINAGAQTVTDVPTPSNYSGVGLLDTRTARFYPDGYLVLTTAFTQPDDRYAITFQVLDWAELSFRYSIDRGFPGNPGTPVLHDRSFDAKIRLAHESANIPELAFGLQDILGTGVYSGEYLVGSKRFGPFDVSLGLGWGRLGSRGTFPNPFGLLSDSFLTRSVDFGQGGVPTGAYFHGPDMGVFGGVEYQTFIENLKLKIEYSSDAYPVEKLHSGRDYSFPVNLGISYRPFSWLDVGLSLMHGRDVGLRISTFIDPSTENWQSRLDPAPRFRPRADENATTILQPGSAPAAASAGVPETRYIDLTKNQIVTSTMASPAPAPPAETTAAITRSISAHVVGASETVPQTAAEGTPADPDVSARLKQGLDSQNLSLLGDGIEGDKIVVLIENSRYRRDTEAIARTARVLSAVAPPKIELFEITLLRVGQPLTTITLPRTEIDKLALRNISPEELFHASEIAPGAAAPLNHIPPDFFPQLGGSIYPVFRQSLFDPNQPVFVRLAVGATEGVRLTRGWFIEGTVVASLYDDFNQIQVGPNSELPNVRSDIANYLKKGKIALENFSTSYFFKLAPEIYGRASAGYLEQMFAGVGGELLYRPFGKRWAIGADLWTVRQRDYHVLLNLRHYQAITGHVTAYYELPWHDVRVAVSAGQYLAGDKGMTFALSRRFSTGVEVGAWFTLTNVSPQRFGEGSFDKGISIIIPFEWVAPFSTRSGYDLSLRPIQRDGGQRLNGDAILYGLTDPSSYGILTREWNSVFK